MKFCLSSRQTPEYLKQADQIKVASRDYKQIYNLIEEYPDKEIILNYQNLTEDTLKEFKTLSKGNLTLCLFSIEDLPITKKLGIPFYFSLPVTTLDQLKAVKNLGVRYALLDNTITHQLHYAKMIGVPLRLIPNLAHLDGIPREDGVCGNWFRPENVDDYSIYIDTIEFGLQPERREQTLFRLYSKDKQWSGDLGRIVQDLNYIGNNLTIDNNLILRRMNCEMKCAYTNCTLCYDIMKISDAIPQFINSENKK